ncbi:Bgt-5502 [Blumeria graminis f. sp. tritici]|uniref:Bgt-5502 n=2 Tax=Blumeria graminis f. sp. tritici TaxID=62690 RepID=A0A061HLK9_BLUGR|nr:hypothetical protein BGT96224_5502 [Blumeria graminis f. sp. tritici 96224]VCU40216.1 Bgt-5502 [Blumeria graminis f. sp. tritici]
MFKWHLKPTLEHGGPVARDLRNLVEGISASLRAFSQSVDRSVEDGNPQNSRKFAAFKEIAPKKASNTRLSVPMRERTTTPSSNVRRIEISRSMKDSGQVPRKTSLVRRSPSFGTGLGVSSNRGGDSVRSKTNFGVRTNRGRGGSAGARGGRGTARTGQGRRTARAPRKKKKWDDDVDEPYDEAEISYLDQRDGGFNSPYNPDTGVENLARHRPPIISNQIGLADSLRYRLAVATDNVSPQYRFSSQHLMRVERGNGTIFEDPEQRALIQEQKDKLDRERAETKGTPYNREDLGILPQKTQDNILKQWVAGHYEAPTVIAPDDPLSYVRNYAKRNETWLPSDARKFEAKLLSLLSN